MAATLIGIDENTCQAIATSELRWYLVSLDTEWVPQELPERSARAQLASGALALTGKQGESPRHAAGDGEEPSESEPPASERRLQAREDSAGPDEFASLDELVAAVRTRCMKQVSPAAVSSLITLDLLKPLALRGALQRVPAPTSISDVFALLRGQAGSASLPHHVARVPHTGVDSGAVDRCLEILFERYHREVFAFASEALQLSRAEAEELTTEVFRQVRSALSQGEAPSLQWCWRQALEIFDSWVAQSPASGN